MNQINSNWFSEISELWPGQCYSLKIQDVLYHEKSDYQDVLVVKTTNHGNALILDGIIQCTERDEFVYQEMITFLALCSHPNPRKVLIIGGGDGGVAREVQKHPSVEQFVQVEIDGKVIEASKKYLPSMAKGFESSKLILNVGDGFEYMKNHKNEFDVVITDSSDPVGPAANLFTESYFELLKGALKHDGVICSQGGTIWTELKQVKKTLENCRKHFPVARYATSNTPTYPNGQLGYVVAALDAQNDVTQPTVRFSEEQLTAMGLRYYDAECHSAAFVLPRFAKRELC